MILAEALVVEWQYVAAIVLAMSTLVGALTKHIVDLRISRASLNLAEDTHLYKRLREQQQKQDRRISQLEESNNFLVKEIRQCEKHKATCEARLRVLEEIHGIMPPPIEDDDENYEGQNDGDSGS